MYEVVYAVRPLKDVPALDLHPRNMTALHDAMGRMITDAGDKLASMRDEDRPGTVIVAIMTDGLENASKEWHGAAIKALVELQTTQYHWEFLYMGADQDAVEVGQGLGIPAANSVTYAKGKAREAMAMSAGKVSGLRRDRAADPAAPLPAFSEQERRDLA